MSVPPGLLARRGYFLLAAAVVALDQATKVAAHARLRGRPPVEIVPGWFDLVYSRNPGGLFGFFGDMAAPWRVALLTVIPLLAVGMIGAVLARGSDVDRPTLTGLGLILGGAVGNLIDRVLRGEVVDFLDVYAGAPRLADWFVERFGTAHWPTFNIADSCIVVGAALLLLGIVRPGRPAPPAPTAPPDPAG